MQALDIFCSIRRTGTSYDSRQLYESNWTLYSSVTSVSKKIYETITDEWHTAWINPRVPSLGVDTERDFHPVVSTSHHTYKADKKLLSRYRTGTIHTPGNWRSLLQLERIMVTSFASHLTTVTKCNPWIKLLWGPWKYSTSKKLKYSSVQTQSGRVVTLFQIGEQLGNAYKRAATGEIAAKDFRATDLFPCDKNIFRPHDFPLASEDTEATLVNHPALMKTSDLPSFSSANFSPFTSAEALPASDISAVPNLNLQSNSSGGTIQKITSSSYRNFVGTTQKKKIRQTTKSKTNRLASNATLGPSK